MLGRIVAFFVLLAVLFMIFGEVRSDLLTPAVWFMAELFLTPPALYKSDRFDYSYC